MTISEGVEYLRAIREAEEIAEEVGQTTNSAHLLLALFTFPNQAKALLNERDIDEERILNLITYMQDEPRSQVNYIKKFARQICQSAGSSEVTTLHLLIAITRTRETFAYYILDKSGIGITALRNTAMSYVSRGIPRRLMSQLNQAPAPRTLKNRKTQEIVEEPPESAQVVRNKKEDHIHKEESLTHNSSSTKHEQLSLPTVTNTEGFVLEKQCPTLAELGVDLITKASLGHLDEVIARDREMMQLVDILGKRRSNNPCLVGLPGVGKTAIVEGLAVKIARGDDDVLHMADKRIIALDTGSLVAGTSLRGAFSERMALLKEEVAKSKGKVVVFIDEIHTLIGAGGSGESAQDAANELKTALARGEFPCIGATTDEEYKKYIEQDTALERRFSPVQVEEPSVDEAILILESAIGSYAEYHQIDYAMSAIHAACTLSERFIPDRRLPDKAFALVDLAGSRARRRNKQSVEHEDIALIVNEWTGVPMERMQSAAMDQLHNAEEVIHRSFVGQEQVVEKIADAIRRGYAGFNGHRPIASLLLLGPTGVGKTELCKVVADLLFGKREALVRMDMSEYSEGHSVARLVGAPPGYVGYGEGGMLTEAVRKRPFQLVLFDEIEKAHKDVLSLLLQLLDEGHLTDSKGRVISFANTLVVLTSNLGFSHHTSTGSKNIGFSSQKEPSASMQWPNESETLEAAREQLAPELWGRIDERLVFEPLSRKMVREIALLQLKESANQLFREREIQLQWNDELLDFLLDNGGFNVKTGARGMRQMIQRHVEANLAKEIIAGKINRGSMIIASPNQKQVVFSEA